MALKWGIASCGKISYDFVVAIHEGLPASDHQIVAVAARSENSAKEFAKNHNIPKYYGGYLGLAQDDEVDVVYVGNINTQHYETTKLMLEHGKHVLVEKPFATNEKQARKLIELAKEKKLFVAEGTWSRFFPAYKEMRRIIESGEIGDVLFASVHFGNALQHVERLTSIELGGGVTPDMGIYVLQFQQYVFRGLKPLSVVATGHKNPQGTDETVGAVFTYPGGGTAVVAVSARVQLPNEAIVVGTKGTIRMPSFWCPTKLITPSGVREWALPATSAKFNHKDSIGLSYEAEGVRQCILKGLTESPDITHEETLELAKLIDFIRGEVGVHYPEDDQEF